MYNIEPIDPRLGRVLGEKKAASIAMKVWGAATAGPYLHGSALC